MRLRTGGRTNSLRSEEGDGHYGTSCCISQPSSIYSTLQGYLFPFSFHRPRRREGGGFIIPQPTDSLLARICCGSCLSCSVSCSVFFPERRLLLPYVERYSSNIFGIKTFLPFSHRSCAFVRIAFSKAERF